MSPAWPAWFCNGGSDLGNQISPKVVIGAIIGVVAIVAAIFFMVGRGGGPGALEGQKPPGMPSDVSSEWQKRMGGANATGPGAGAPGPGGAPMMTGPGMTGPGAGIPEGK
jgi:hypothetical protein